MGTRLYPNTDNAAVIEKLAGVRAGTYARYQEVLAKEPEILRVVGRKMQIMTEYLGETRTGEITLTSLIDCGDLVVVRLSSGQIVQCAAWHLDQMVWMGMQYNTLLRQPNGTYIGRGRNHLGILDDFLLYGWGRVKGYTTPCGQSYSDDHVAYLLAVQGVALPKGVSIADLGGVCWS